MGQQLAVEMSEDIPLHIVVDRATAHYISTQTNIDVERFAQEDFCKDVESLVTDILSRNVNDLDAQVILQRITKGQKQVDMSEITPCVAGSETGLSDREAIARFYTAVAHLYAVLARASGGAGIPDTEVNVDNTEPRLQRIKDIIRIQLQNVRLIEDVYQLEKKMEYRKSVLPDLEPLYFDVYDPSAQLYTQMSEGATAQFRDDIKSFYAGFADDDIPPDILTYADITLSKSHKSSGQEFPELLKEYGRATADIVASARGADSQIAPIMDQVIVEIDGVRTVHPDLNIDRLNALMENAREVIVGEYIENEGKYLKGLEIFEAVIEHQLGRTMQNQLANLNNQLYVLVSQ